MDPAAKRLGLRREDDPQAAFRFVFKDVVTPRTVVDGESMRGARESVETGTLRSQTLRP